MPFFFIDNITAYHSSISLQSDGSKKSERELTPFVENLRCQLSYGGDDSATPKGREKYPNQRDLKVFVVGIDHGFKSGDWVVIRRNGTVVYEGAIGEPKIYDRLLVHTELSIDAFNGGRNG